MDRRQFLTAGISGAVLGCGGAAASGPASASASAPHAELEEASVADLAARMTRGEISARELVVRHLARIEAIDRSGPALRAILETNPEALATAEALDVERAKKGPRSPLHGIPVVVKDNVDTEGEMKTTAGSLALVDAPAPKDATIVAKLRAAGAVILGKTNLSEWANIRSDRSTSGWSARGGFTRCPYALDRNPSGSSSGTASAIAASLAVVGVGTETNGSILSPSQIAGLVGMKPTVGLVSRAGIVPISSTQDTAGPMARSVSDAALLLSVIAGSDARDAATSGARAEHDYTALLDRDALRGKKLGVMHAPWAAPAVARSFEAALDTLKHHGATLVDLAPKPHPELEDAELDLLLTDLVADLGAYLVARGGALRSLADVVRWNEAHAAQELAVFGQELFERALEKPARGSPEYAKTKETCRKAARDEGLDPMFAQGLDAIVAPTGGPAWLTDPVNGDSFTGAGYGLAAIAGYPSLTVPMGATHGLPLGLCFMGRPWSEARLLAMAYAFEQATKHRAKPTYATSAAI